MIWIKIVIWQVAQYDTVVRSLTPLSGMVERIRKKRNVELVGWDKKLSQKNKEEKKKDNGNCIYIYIHKTSDAQSNCSPSIDQCPVSPQEMAASPANSANFIFQCETIWYGISFGPVSVSFFWFCPIPASSTHKAPLWKVSVRSWKFLTDSMPCS